MTGKKSNLVIAVPLLILLFIMVLIGGMIATGQIELGDITIPQPTGKPPNYSPILPYP